jgi:selenocysteine-specific elongation factor
VGSGPLTLGTAGHIDHGKTALVQALTGVDTDRLPEEKSRGISIALGYAPLQLRSGRSLSVIDVPGHERFVRTMVAGATGIDLFLMVVAVDDGVMPQTIEHATVLDALGVRSGVIAVTKTDLADPRSALREARDLLPGCERAACSTRTGEGVEDVRGAIDRVAARLLSRAAAGRGPVLHIDRSFSIRGQGTVVTGTLWSGELAQGDTLALLPAGELVRIRAIEVHGEPMEHAAAGQRVAVNLTGVRIRTVGRGDVLAEPGLLAQTTTLDCALTLDHAEHNARVRVHHGTREAPGRLAALGENLWQVRLERPILAADGDRIVIRRPSPPGTLGGGQIIDAHARRHGPRPEIVDRLRRRRDGRPEPTPENRDLAPLPAAGTREERPDVDEAELAALVQRLLDSWLRPLTPAQLGTDNDALKLLCRNGTAVRVSGELYMHTHALASAQIRAIEAIECHGAITLAGLRDELEISRKSAQALLEHFDSTHVTRRLPDDSRVLSRRLAKARA